MKEIQDIKSDKVGIVKQAEIKTQEKFVKRFKPHKGHTLFEVNKKTGEINPAEYKVEDLSFENALKGDISTHKKVIMKDNCIYVSALNIKNVLKKIGIKVR